MNRQKDFQTHVWNMNWWLSENIKKASDRFFEIRKFIKKKKKKIMIQILSKIRIAYYINWML